MSMFYLHMQIAPQDLLETIVLIRVYIHVMELSVMTHAIVPVHCVIMFMDVISQSLPKQVRVDTLVMVMSFHKLPLYTTGCILSLLQILAYL